MTEKRNPVAASVWAKPSKGRADAPSLGREQIVAAAIELLDADGLSGLTIRKLGERLGSGATSVYWYVSNKTDLLDLVLDECWGRATLPDPASDDWQGQSAAYARGLREVVMDHPWMTSLFGRHANVGPHANRMSDACLGLMARAGFAPMECAQAASALSTYALGFAMTDAAHRTMLESSGMTLGELTASIDKYFDESGDDLPNFQQWRKDVGPLDVNAMRNETFEYGLARLLDGLKARLDDR